MGWVLLHALVGGIVIPLAIAIVWAAVLASAERDLAPGHEWAIFLPILPSAAGWFTFVHWETTRGKRVLALVAFLAAGIIAMVLASLPLAQGIR